MIDQIQGCRLSGGAQKGAPALDRYRLKNIIILILILVNVFLIGSLTIRKAEERSARRQAAEELVELFAAGGVSLDPDIISEKTPPASRALMRDTALDARAAAFLLGEDPACSNQGGGIYTYSSPSGTAMFRSTGSFDAKGTLVTEDADDFCRTFCKRFSYGAPVFQLDESGNGEAVAMRYCDGLPVFNCSVTFTFRSNVLIAVSGILLPESYADVTPSSKALSSSAALIAFQRTNTVVSAVTDLYLCYELQSTTASSMTLVPAWCIVTDTAKYYVNCNTGDVTAA